jgi:hypothetical protein
MLTFSACCSVVGYDLYGSALADILSEPSLSMPITGKEAEVEKLVFFLSIFESKTINPYPQSKITLVLLALFVNMEPIFF